MDQISYFVAFVLFGGIFVRNKLLRIIIPIVLILSLVIVYFPAIPAQAKGKNLSIIKTISTEKSRFIKKQWNIQMSRNTC